ncbi:MAG TPA: hypothetical protein VGI23_26055, partial [Steroidobacteraceae bacterium]
MSGADVGRVFQVWALSLLAALYLFRGILEFPSTGWRPQTILTSAVGLGLLPVIAALAAAPFSWRQWVITVLCVLGLVINAALVVVLWNGFTQIVSLTLLIVVLYTSVAWVNFMHLTR